MVLGRRLVLDSRPRPPAMHPYVLRFTFFAQDPGRGAREVGGDEVRRAWRGRFAVSVPEEHRATAGALARLDVLPAVPDQVAGGHVQGVARRRLQDQARPRLAAVAVVDVVVVAGEDGLEWQRGQEGAIDLLDHLALLGPAGDV